MPYIPIQNRPPEAGAADAKRLNGNGAIRAVSEQGIGGQFCHQQADWGRTFLQEMQSPIPACQIENSRYEQYALVGVFRFHYVIGVFSEQSYSSLKKTFLILTVFQF
jgi:hypothetical protein